MTVQFDAQTHVYTVSGRWAPGCTKILADVGYLKGAAWFTEESRVRGTQAHLACAMADQYAPNATDLDDVLDVIEVGDALIPYLQGYLLFKRETGYRPVWSEQLMYMESPLVAGTPDSWGHYGDGRRVLCDLKSWKGQGPNPKRAAVLQTAGYALMVRERTGESTDLRVIVALPGDGRYRAYECRDPRDESLFLCAAHLWHDRFAHKLIEGSEHGEVEIGEE